MIFFGHVSPVGILELDHPELYSDLLKSCLANCRVQLDIDRKKTPRSHQQNAYLWAAVYPVIAEHCGYSIPETHEVCKQLFLPPRQMSIGDRMVTVAGSTARLTTAEMMDYIERVIVLAGELACVVQTPEEAGFISNSNPEDICSHRVLLSLTQCMVRPCVARDFVDLASAVLHQCIRSLIGARCAPDHHGYQRACDLINGQASFAQSFGAS